MFHFLISGLDGFDLTIDEMQPEDPLENLIQKEKTERNNKLGKSTKN
jgi:hypothetical protein